MTVTNGPSSGLRRWRAATFEALGSRDYRILWIGTTLAFMAFMMSWVAQSVVAFDLTGKNESVGVVALGMGISSLLIAPFGGAVADRISKRRLLLIGQALAGLNFFVVGLLILTDVITIWLLVGSTFLLGVVFSFIAPARQAWVGEILPERLVPNGIALTQVAMTGTRIFGPLLAGVLIAISFIGTGGAYVAMGGLFVLVVATLARLPNTAVRVSTGPKKGVLADLADGARHVIDRPRLALLAGSFILVVMTGYSYQVILPGYLENQLDRQAKDLSVLVAATAVTGLVVTIAIAGAANSKYAWGLMIGGAAALGVSLLILSVAPNFTVAILAMLLTGAGTGAFQMLNNALVMQESAPEYYGRVMSLTMMAWGVNGLAGWPIGFFADTFGERTTVFGMGIGVLVVTVATMAIYSALRGRAPVTPMMEPRTEAVAGDGHPAGGG